jgi:hypothetical protein
MTLEALVAAGLTEAQAKEVLKLHKAAIDGNYVPKTTFEDERQKLKDANTTIADRDKQIKELGGFKGTAEELQKKVGELEAANTAAADKYAKDLEAANNLSGLKLELTGKCHDPADVIAKLDMTKVTFKDGKPVAGLNEQVEELKKTHAHYFPTEDKKPGGFFPGGFNIQGGKPKEGTEQNKGGEDKLTDAQKFGQSLAQNKAAANSVATKASEVYFK